jgi:hypothetical protein
MAAAPVLIPLDQLRPHPDNPRLFERAEVVGQIAFQIAAVSAASIQPTRCWCAR